MDRSLKIAFLFLCLLCMFSSSVLAATMSEEIQIMIRDNKAAAELALQRENFHHAIRILQLNQQLNPENYQHVLSEATAYMTWAEKVRGKYGVEQAKPYFLDAATVFDRAIRVAQENQVDEAIIWDMRYQKIISLIRAQAYEEARNLLNEALQIRPRDALANYLMGLAIRFEYVDIAETGTTPPAEWVFQSNRYFERAIEYANRELIPYAYFFSGFAYYELGQVATALRYLKTWQEQFKTMKEAQGLNYADYDTREKLYWDYTTSVIVELEEQLGGN